MNKDFVIPLSALEKFSFEDALNFYITILGYGFSDQFYRFFLGKFGKSFQLATEKRIFGETSEDVLGQIEDRRTRKTNYG